jgi:hypothetical protein
VSFVLRRRERFPVVWQHRPSIGGLPVRTWHACAAARLVWRMFERDPDALRKSSRIHGNASKADRSAPSLFVYRLLALSASAITVCTSNALRRETRKAHVVARIASVGLGAPVLSAQIRRRRGSSRLPTAANDRGRDIRGDTLAQAKPLLNLLNQTAFCKPYQRAVKFAVSWQGMVDGIRRGQHFSECRGSLRRSDRNRLEEPRVRPEIAIHSQRRLASTCGFDHPRRRSWSPSH